MESRAHVTSVEAIGGFRAALIVYLSKARPALQEVSNELLRTRLWLQEDHRRHWDGELRIRKRVLERAQAELFSAKMSRMGESSAVQVMGVQRALTAVRQAEQKLVLLKRWDRELEHRAAPLVKQVEQLGDFLATDMAKAVAVLEQTVKALEAYAGVAVPGSGVGGVGGASRQAGGGEAEEGGGDATGGKE